jgi:hypothetical protein
MTGWKIAANAQNKYLAPMAGLFSTRRQGLGADNFLVQLDDLGLSGNVPDRFFMVFGEQRRRLVAGELSIFAHKFRVFIGFAKRLLENSDAILWGSGWKDGGTTGNSESTRQN